MPMTELELIEAGIKQSKETIAIGKSLERLFNNADFKKIVLDLYMEKDALRLVQLKADPSMQSEGSQKSILTQIDAIGALSQFFQTLRFKISMAEKALEVDEQMRDELLEEGL